MNFKSTLSTLIISLGALALGGCGSSKSGDPNIAANHNAGQQVAPAPNVPAALPDNGFKAMITLVDPPAKLRAGQKQTVQVKIKNASDVQWYARGAEINTNPDNKFYLSIGNRWLDAKETLITDMDGRFGLPKDLKPGEETEAPLVITAPKNPGDYILELDVIQEQVVWFHDKGSQPARVKIKVE
jgi:hypothetical protein